MVVQIPLEAVEGGPHPLADVGAVGEAARPLVGEDLAQGALVGVGLGAVREDEVVLGVVGVARQRSLRPAVLVGGVVEDEVEHQADAVLPQERGEGAQIVDGAQLRVDGAIVADGIAAVVVAFRRAEERHEVQVGDARAP